MTEPGLLQQETGCIQSWNGDNRSTLPDEIWEMSSISALMQMIWHKSCVRNVLPDELHNSFYWTYMSFSPF